MSHKGGRGTVILVDLLVLKMKGWVGPMEFEIIRVHLEHRVSISRTVTAYGIVCNNLVKMIIANGAPVNFARLDERLKCLSAFLMSVKRGII